MGLSYHELNLLKNAVRTGPLGDVITLGRQNINVSPAKIRRTLGENTRHVDDTYVDGLLGEKFGAATVSSVDASDYEGATHVADLNKPFSLGRTFDTVIDFGTSEHVFDIAAALRNAIGLCAVGGRILHSSPANSECGHGFYQFSPELYFSLYSERNGFVDTRVHAVRLMDETHWHRVRPAGPGERIMINSLSATYLLVSTRKVRDVSALSVQQSDYVHSWETNTAQTHATARWRDRAREALVGSTAAGVATLVYRSWLAKTGVTRFNPYLQRVPVGDPADLPHG